MINASVDFRRTMTERTDFIPYVKITFADGRTVDLANNDFSISNNALTDGAESNSFPLGAAVCRSFQMEIKNYDQKFKDYNFYRAVLQIRLYFQLNTGKPEIINFGQFTITTPEAYGTVITVQAVDNMYKTNTSYTTNLTFPCALLEVVKDCCKQCNLPLKTAAFNNSNFIVKNKPENISFREVLAQAAMIAGGYARIDRSGYLQIVTYDLSVFEKEGLGDGGTFEDSEESSVYVDGDKLDGGTFSPWNTGDVLDSGQFTSMDNYHVFYDFMSDPQVDADDIVITGIQMADTDGSVKLCGEEGYVLNIENQLAKGNEQDAVNRIGKLINGFKFRAFSGEYIGYPLAEFGDVCYISDQSGNVYQSILTDVTFRFFGKASLKCSADSPLRNSSKSAYNSDYVKAVIAARNYMEQELSAYDLAVQQMNQLAANTLGFYQTAVKQDNGSLIVYRHDKPKLAESKIVYKSGIDGFFVTQNYTGNDSTTVWKSGFDSSGNAVLNILSVIGIHWDWATGGTLTLGGKGNGNGELKVLDENGNIIGTWDKDGIQASKGTFSGNLSAAGGTFSGNLQAAGGTFKGNLEAAGGSFSGKISAAEGTIAGWNIEKDGLSKDGAVISSEGSVDEEDFSDKTHIYPDGISAKQVMGRLRYKNGRYTGYSGTLTVVTDVNGSTISYREIIVKDGCIVTRST